MLPWESLPFLRNQEVYRMPSVISIKVVLDKYNNKEVQVETHSVPFPSINPYDDFFVLNPDGSLKVFQIEFEEYFKRNFFEVISQHICIYVNCSVLQLLNVL